jgi:multidrug transporter EmrE-like cation transporter
LSFMERVERYGVHGLALIGMAGLMAIAIGLATPALARLAAMAFRLAGTHALMLSVFAAALSFTVGGIFMKLSEGLTKPLPTLCLLLFFVVGACLQTLAMRGGELGVVYIVVLGVEAVLAFAFGCLLFNERVTLIKSAGILAILAGIIALRH